MNTQTLPIEDQNNFEELLESHLEIPQVEEEGMLEISASHKKENAAKTAECVMPAEKSIHRNRRKTKARKNKQKKSLYEMRTAHVQNIGKAFHELQNVARKEISAIRSTRYYDGIRPKNRVLHRDLNADKKEQLQEYNAAGLTKITPMGGFYFF